VKKNRPDYYNDLDKIYLKIWELLNSGLSNRDAPFHIPTFICGEGKNFDGRMVVLRGINEKNKNLWFHTDIRSKKIKILQNNPRAALLFYDRDEKIQLRISVNTNINYQNNITKKAWKKTPHMSRQCYLGEKTPGSNTSIPTSGLSDDFDNFNYSLEESESGYKNFCLIESFITSIEWLYLAAKGHRRAHFVLTNNTVEKKWIIP
tara:strand:+ start:731 stop:1345 length:615 start_codon:yes stop_codon:yes gene_type:complete